MKKIFGFLIILSILLPLTADENDRFEDRQRGLSKRDFSKAIRQFREDIERNPGGRRLDRQELKEAEREIKKIMKMMEAVESKIDDFEKRYGRFPDEAIPKDDFDDPEDGNNDYRRDDRRNARRDDNMDYNNRRPRYNDEKRRDNNYRRNDNERGQRYDDNDRRHFDLSPEEFIRIIKETEGVSRRDRKKAMSLFNRAMRTGQLNIKEARDLVDRINGLSSEDKQKLERFLEEYENRRMDNNPDSNPRQQYRDDYR